MHSQDKAFVDLPYPNLFLHTQEEGSGLYVNSLLEIAPAATMVASSSDVEPLLLVSMRR